MKTVRYDRLSFSKPFRTDSGFIKGNPIVTRTGIFRYMNEDGTIRRELRHPDDVFSARSLDSLKGIPVTLRHPPELVNSENAVRYQKGYTGDNVSVDGQNVLVNITISHEDAIKEIENGVNQLSLGYELTLVDEVGEYNGETYDARQTEIVYNHLSIVETARAGKDANIKLDSGFEVSISLDSISNIDSHQTNKERVDMKKVNLDGVIHDVDDAIATHIDKIVVAKDSAETRLKIVEQEKSALQGRVDATDAELAKVKAENSDEAIAKKVLATTKIIDGAKKILGANSNFDGLTVEQIIDNANKKFNGDKAVEGDSTYKKAYFDIAVQSTNKDSEDIASQRQTVNNPSANNDEDESSDSLFNFDSEDEDRNLLMNGYANPKA